MDSEDRNSVIAVPNFSVHDIRPEIDRHDVAHAGGGLQLSAHVPIDVGLADEVHRDLVVRILESVGSSFEISVSRTKVVQKPDFDLLCLEVQDDSRRLPMIRKLFAGYPHEQENTDESFHVPLAALKRGHGKKYAGKSAFVQNLAETRPRIDRLLFSPKDDNLRAMVRL